MRCTSVFGANNAQKTMHATQDNGVMAQALVNKNSIPHDQAEFDQITVIAGAPTDPWGAPYVYDRLSTRKVRISSKGPDGQVGTADDVVKEFEFASGMGLDNLEVKRPDGTVAIKSPNGKLAFWTTSRDVGNQQITDYWIGDATANAKSPIKTAKVGTDVHALLDFLRTSVPDGRAAPRGLSKITRASTPSGGSIAHAPVRYSNHGKGRPPLPVPLQAAAVR